GASMNDIARAAGVSKGTLYAYFTYFALPDRRITDRTVRFDFSCHNPRLALCQQKMTEPFGQHFLTADISHERYHQGR
ncbi:MAG TPA: helix-turn-helix domain-containing protein, partial [Roseiarcus sp.]